MQTHQQITHISTENLMHRLLSSIPKTNSGTYNRADPTHWEKGEIEFLFKNKNMVLAYHDCTWGVNIILCIKQGFKERELANIYLSREYPQPDTIIAHKGMNNILPILFQISRILEPIPEPEYTDFEDPMGCLADYVTKKQDNHER